MAKMSKHDKLVAQGENRSKSKYEYTTIDYVILVAVIFICLWSWIFVEPDTLQRSAAAQAVVKAVTSVLPWVAALERYGPQAHQVMLVHSVCYLVFSPLIAIYVNKLFSNRSKFDLPGLLLGLLISLIIFFLTLTPYYNLKKTFEGTAGRQGYDLLVQFWSMPLMACLCVGCTLFLSITIVRGIIDVAQSVRMSNG